ncbi:MAG: sensor histidine kinase [Lacisediminihabitans sp.]
MTLKPRRSRWSLRRRLVMSIVALLAIASVTIGLISALTLQQILMTRLDEQLTSATHRSRDFAQRPSEVFESQPAVPPTTFSGGPAQAPETIGARIRHGVILRADYIDSGGVLRHLTESQAKIVLAVPADGRPRTVNLGGDLGDYRMVVAGMPGGNQLAIGLPLGGVQSTVYQLLAVIGAVIVLGLVVAGFASALIVRLALRPLQRVVATATHVAELPLDRGDVALAVRVPESDADPGTEVGQVGAAINRMLGHVASALTARQASENKVRQFVADASHELRTPLASIRGYSELTRRGNHELPDDVVHAMSRVESEATRMTSLVEDLLLLARLDEGRDLERSSVDLSRLLIDAVSDAHAAGPDHSWALDLPEEPVVIVGDGARLHQVIANLLANARVHTPAATEVQVSLGSGDSATVVVTVSDSGPGIPDELQPLLFERFVRGDSSRSRAAGSTGLGLAIVSAVVEGHGGRVTVDSSPGRTSFRVELPAAEEKG